MVTASAFGQTTPGTARSASDAVAPSDIDGVWVGTLSVNAIKLRLAFHIANTTAGLTATMDSLDQGAKGIPVSSLVREGSSVKMEVKVAQGQFSGEISKDLRMISGTWSQGGNSLPLELRRVKDLAALTTAHPQEPKRPLPYREEEVSYPNAAAPGVTLAGTLTLPEGKGPFPAVLLITGSGPQDRDETIFGHKPFFILSDYLTRKGIAVLRVDDRGTGKSTGNFASATTADFAADAEAGVAFLNRRPEINPKRIGLIGHSEGGLIAPMIAARTPDVSFLVLMAGSGVPGDEVLSEQARMLIAASGATAEQLTAASARQHDLLELFKSEKDPASFERKLRESMQGRMSEAELNLAIAQTKGPWFRYFVEYDPATALRKTTVPVLALNGSKDLQVSSTQNLPAIRKALEAAHNKDFQTVELAGLNHLFQTAQNGLPLEYGKLEETISPVALDKIASWLLAHAR
jgi:pimeloyl-ACP methyl ester carboxylesterase